MIEKGKIIVDDEGIKYKGKNTKLVQDFFDPTKYDGDFSITERFKLFGSILCNTFWLVNDYAQQYVDDKGVKEDALKTLLDKFQNRNIDQQIHKSCDRHSLLIAALQKDKNYEYGDVVKTEGAIDGYLKILSLISPKRYEEYLLKQKNKNVHYSNKEQLVEANKTAYQFISNLVKYEKQSEKYILYRGGEGSLDWETATYKTICYSDGLFAGMLDPETWSLDISWNRRIRLGKGSYLQRLELDRKSLLNGDYALFIPHANYLLATFGCGEIYHPRSKVMALPYMKIKGEICTDEKALGINGETGLNFTPKTTPEYFLPEPVCDKNFTGDNSVDDEEWKKRITGDVKKWKTIRKISDLCKETSFIDVSGKNHI
ncbi:MAG: hypothetical protein IJ599_03120 [Alphaproteobacteria bacterium]|nr:hypothetical protein [Alphaproteobacteria bacterium]